MSDRVHANAPELEAFSRRLRTNGENVIKLAKELEFTLRTIDWNDRVKERIDHDVHDATHGLKKLADQLFDHSREVDLKARQLRDFLGR
ncbi:hypothetical protein [Brevibacterium metallidurans]|uniref:WXG100 family type VII secretion target n=1 Tax=Brevibacterium metallidurans TaxID=1482676 RepID=A0ABN0SJ67_9MICO